MSSAERRPRVPREAGFTLLEAMLAFALIAISMSFLTIANEQSFRSGVKALGTA